MRAAPTPMADPQLEFHWLLDPGFLIHGFLLQDLRRTMLTGLISWVVRLPGDRIGWALAETSADVHHVGDAVAGAFGESVGVGQIQGPLGA